MIRKTLVTDEEKQHLGRRSIIDYMKRFDIESTTPYYAPANKKNSKQSTEFRNAAERNFLKSPSDLKLASELYNKSIAFAPKAVLLKLKLSCFEQPS